LVADFSDVDRFSHVKCHFPGGKHFLPTGASDVFGSTIGDSQYT
jgi:hypothetical protein